MIILAFIEYQLQVFVEFIHAYALCVIIVYNLIKNVGLVSLSEIDHRDFLLSLFS